MSYERASQPVQGQGKDRDRSGSGIANNNPHERVEGKHQEQSGGEYRVQYEGFGMEYLSQRRTWYALTGRGAGGGGRGGVRTSSGWCPGVSGLGTTAAADVMTSLPACLSALNSLNMWHSPPFGSLCASAE
jgi:hypothetical protein